MPMDSGIVELNSSLDLDQPIPAPSGEMTEDRVIGKFWPDNYSLVGPPVRVFDLEDIADNLAVSGFMVPWIAAKIREELKNGTVFQNVSRMGDGWRGRADGVKAEYRMASRDELLNFAETVRAANVTGHAMSRRSQEKEYILHYLDSNEVREHYETLPRQAKVVLDILNDSGRENLTEAAIEVLLVEGAEKLRTKQEPMKIFAFYRKVMVDGGHLEEVGNDE